MYNNNSIKIRSFLSPRLLAIADCVKEASVLADIGTDHAYIPIYLACENRISHAIAMDIKRGPLLRAQKNIEKFGLIDRIETRLSDGMQALKYGEADTIVIAGMGGTLIADILTAAPDYKNAEVRFVLQPMTAIYELRKYLASSGYRITDERLARENEKIYTIIEAGCGTEKEYGEVFYHIGAKLMQNRDELAPLLIQQKVNEFSKIYDGLKGAKRASVIISKIDYCEDILGELYKLQKECNKWPI